MPYLKLNAKSDAFCTSGYLTEFKFPLILWNVCRIGTLSIKTIIVSCIKPTNQGSPSSTTLTTLSPLLPIPNKVSKIYPVLTKIPTAHPQASTVEAKTGISLPLLTPPPSPHDNKIKLIPLTRITFDPWQPTITSWTRDIAVTPNQALSPPLECLFLRVHLGPIFTEILRLTILSVRDQRELLQVRTLVKAMRALN